MNVALSGQFPNHSLVWDVSQRKTGYISRNKYVHAVAEIIVTLLQ